MGDSGGGSAGDVGRRGEVRVGDGGVCLERGGWVQAGEGDRWKTGRSWRRG